MYSVISCLHQAKEHVDRLNHYNKPEYINDLNFEGINFPVKIQDIPKFESDNKINVTVFSYEEQTFYPLYHNNKQFYEMNIDLLYFGNEEKNHYCWIKNLSRLLNDQLEVNRSKKYFCRRCLNYSARTEDALKKHQKVCFSNEPCVPNMPEDNVLQFKNIQRMLRHPYVIYSDFESILKPIHTCKPNPESSYTHKTQFHIPCGYGLYVKSAYNNIDNPLEIYRGEESDKCFIKRITEHARTIYYKLLKENKPIKDIELGEYRPSHIRFISEFILYATKNTNYADH
jgi:hypothetical protein